MHGLIYLNQLILVLNRLLMLADYVMKSIDSLFSERLNCKENAQKEKNQQVFDKETIRKSLHKVIRKDQTPKSPQKLRKEELSSTSTISKSKLKLYLETNRDQRIDSVLKDKRQPFANEMQNNNTKRTTKITQNFHKKETNAVRYYQQMRKSIQKSHQRSKSLKRIFQISKNQTHLSSLICKDSKNRTKGIRL